MTAIGVFERGSAVQRASVSAGEIAKLWGLGKVRIGDRSEARAAPRPSTTSLRRRWRRWSFPTIPDDKARLRVALGQLAEQDPLIDVRQDDTRQEISVSLYGEVQKEVIQATLANDFGLDVGFSETTTICIERPTGTGEAVEILHAEANPFLATIGLRIESAPAGSGIEFRLQVDFRAVPLYVYKRIENFAESMGEYVREALREGLFGWQVTDCVVTMIECNYSSPDGPAATRGPLSTAADFRKLTPLVVMQALERARMVVCEPILRVSLEIPTGTIGAVMSALARLGAAAEAPSLQGKLARLETVVPAARAAGPPAAADGADERRRRARVRLRRLPPGWR